jgi:hypothetical protein
VRFPEILGFCVRWVLSQIGKTEVCSGASSIDSNTIFRYFRDGLSEQAGGGFHLTFGVSKKNDANFGKTSFVTASIVFLDVLD